MPASGPSVGGATQLDQLTDVSDATPTNRNVLFADGVDWASRRAAAADIVFAAASRFLARITGGAGDGEEITGTQATTLLDVFTDLLKGVVPASGGGVVNFLRADGTFAAPPGGGGDLDSLSDVTIAAVAVNEFLRNDGAGQWRNVLIGLTNLDDVNTAAVTNRFVLIADGVDYESRRAVVTDINFTAANRICGKLSVPGDGSELTGAQVTTLLAVFTSILKGLVPASGGGVINFLRADGTFAIPPGGVTSLIDLDDVDSATPTNRFSLFGNGGSFDSRRAVAADLAFAATARFLARITGGAGDGEELTGTQATTLLDIFASALQGLVPASGGGVVNFLRADGAFAVPPGGVTQLTDLSDVNTAAVTNRFVLIADGVDYESRRPVAADVNFAAANQFLGISGGPGDGQELGGTAATALLDLFDAIDKGLVPLSGGGTVNFIRADGIWAVPPGSVTQLTDLSDVNTAAVTNRFALFADGVDYESRRAVAADLAFAATARFLARITGGAGDGEELTGTQATTLLDVFTSLLKGLVPASAGGSTNFLRADGVFAVPGGGGGADAKSGVETGITEGTTRVVTFGTAFTGATPDVVVSFADNSTQLSQCAGHTPSLTGFTIQVEQIGGGGASTRDVSWFATQAGDP